MGINRDKVLASAVKLLHSGKFDKAIAEFRRLIDDDPKDVRTILKVGDAYVKMGRRVEAIEAYERVAKIYSEQGFYLKAVAVYKQMLRVDPNLPDVHHQLAEMYQQLGLSSDALQHFQQVAVYYERQGATAESLNILKRMVDLDPDNLPSRIKLAELFAQQGMNQEAIAEFRSAGEHLIEQERFEDYVRVGERLIYFDPRALDVTRQLAEIYLDRGEAKLALGKLQLCFKASPRDLEILELIATAFNAMGQAAKTLSVFKEMARIYESDDDAANAQRAWQRVLDTDPNDAEARQALGTGGAPVAQPPLAQAAQAAQPAVDPEDEQIARLLTETDVYVKYSLFDKAIDHVRKALALRPDLIDAQDKLRAIYQGTGDREGLIAQLRVLVQRGESLNDPRLEQWRHDLDTLTAAPPPGPPVAEPPPAEEPTNDAEFVSFDSMESGAVEIDDAAILEEASIEPSILTSGLGDAPFDAAPVVELSAEDQLPDLPSVAAAEDDLIVAPAESSLVLPPDLPDEVLAPVEELVIPAAAEFEVRDLEPEAILGADAPGTGVDDSAEDEPVAEVSLVDQAAVDDALAESRALMAEQYSDFDSVSSADALPLDAADEVVRALEGASDDDLLAGFERSVAEAPPVTELGPPDLGDLPSDDMAEAIQRVANEAVQADFDDSATELMELSAEDMDEIRDLIGQAAQLRAPEAEEDSSFEEHTLAVDGAGLTFDGLPDATELPVGSDLDLNAVAAQAADEYAELPSDFQVGTDDEILTANTAPEFPSDIVTAAPAESFSDLEEQADAFEGGIGFPPPLANYERSDFGEAVAAPDDALDEVKLDGPSFASGEELEELPSDLADFELPDADDLAAFDEQIEMTDTGGGPFDEKNVMTGAEIAALKSPTAAPGKKREVSLGVSQEAYGFEDDPAASFFPDELEEAEFFIQNDLLDEAKEILDEIIEDVPDSRRAKWMIDRITAKENDEPEPLAPWKQRIIDEVEEEIDDLEPTLGTDDNQISLEEVLSQFKKGVAETVGDDDADTHYNLGIAYKEMGLFDDSIAEFKLASRAPGRRIDSFFLIAVAYRDKGDDAAALEAVEDALNDVDITSDQRAVGNYERGVCLEGLGRATEALEAFELAKAAGCDVGDLGDRIAKLAGSNGVGNGASHDAPSVGDDEPRRRKNIDYV